MLAQSEFHWFSPLGVSVALFLLYGIVYLIIGSLTPVFMDARMGKQGIIISYRTDVKLFSDEPDKLLDTNTDLAKTRRIILNMLAGMLVSSGILIIGVTWFGLRTGQLWSLILLAIVGVAVLPFWWLVFKPYLDAGIKITLGDAPPFIWVPAFLYLPAVIMGWIGLAK